MSEPTVALAFTPDFWVEELHRHLTDHGGARVRCVVVESTVALEESYDVLVAGHRWPALTRGLVNDVHARNRVVLGVFDREEPGSRTHLLGLGVDCVVESDAGRDAFVRAIVGAAGSRSERATAAPGVPEVRPGRLVTVGGAPGSGRTEIATQLARVLATQRATTLLDADDIAPAVAQRLHLPIEPNVCTAIDAVEHGRGTLDQCRAAVGALRVVVGVPNARAWTQIRPGEVLRIVDQLAGDPTTIVVADGAGPIEDLAGNGSRARYATARALVSEADALVAICDASPHGIARVLAWCVEARSLAHDTPTVVVVNRAPVGRFARGELFEELRHSLPIVDVVFVPHDRRVVDAAWAGTAVAKGPFVRGIDRLAELVAGLPRRAPGDLQLEAAS